MTAPRARGDRRSHMHVHAGSLHELVEMIERSLTCASIMTPWESVECIDAEEHSPETARHARELMTRRNYSGVPLVCGGPVLGVYVRHDPSDKPRFESARGDHFIDPSTRLIELIRAMRDRKCIVAAVGDAKNPIGWVTYADFSKRPFRVLLFSIVAEVEYLLAQALDTAHPDEDWLEVVPADVRARLEQRREKALSWDATMPLTSFAEIGDLIRAVSESPRARELLGGGPELARRLQAITQLRNRVSHVVRPVVPGPKQIGSVADQLDMLLEWIAQWSGRINARF